MIIRTEPNGELTLILRGREAGDSGILKAADGGALDGKASGTPGTDFQRKFVWGSIERCR